VNIRGTGGEEVLLAVDGEVIGSMERWRAMQNAHAGAVYLHRGQSYVVESLDLEMGRAELKPEETSYYTRPTVQSILQQTLELQGADIGKYRVSLAAVNVTTMVIGFSRKSLDGERILDVESLDMPPTSYDTLAVRFDLPALGHDDDPQEHLGAIHGLEHALMAVAPILAGCDRGDLGSTWYSVAPDTLKPAVYVFDQTPGGVGLCEKLFDNSGRWVVAAYQLLATCECGEGCPACLLSARCESMNEALYKKGALGHLTDLSP
jgi:DEAD/DEAH box helicase domain-containing protein